VFRLNEFFHIFFLTTDRNWFNKVLSYSNLRPVGLGSTWSKSSADALITIAKEEWVIPFSIVRIIEILH